MLGSVLFLAFAFFASPDWPHVGRMLHNPHGVEDVVFQAEMLLFFYLNYFVLIDRFYFPKRYLLYAILLVLIFLFCGPLTGVMIRHFLPENFHPEFRMPMPPHRKHGFMMFLINREFYLFLLTLAFSLFLRIWQRLKRIEQDKIGAELNLLKAQINPHFLFNTLNSIYALSLQKSDVTSDAIVKLSSMMRYVLKDAEHKYVYLKDEISYLNDYIELQKLRLNPNVHLDLQISGDYNQAKIAPLMLIPFIENAFKYGVSTEGRSEIEIHIFYIESELRLAIRNSKPDLINGAGESTELGLNNAKKRLLLLYPDKHTLTIEDKKEDFFVNLVIQLHD